MNRKINDDKPYRPPQPYDFSKLDPMKKKPSERRQEEQEYVDRMVRMDIGRLVDKYDKNDEMLFRIAKAFFEEAEKRSPKEPVSYGDNYDE